MEDLGGENAAPSDSKPARMRLRGKSSLVSSSSSLTATGWTQTKKWRHITNIQKINVINNFGMDRDKRVMEHMGWLLLRIVLSILIIVWFGALVSVTRGASLPPSPDNDNSKGDFLDLLHITTKSKVTTKSKDLLESKDLDMRSIDTTKSKDLDMRSINTTKSKYLESNDLGVDSDAIVALKALNMKERVARSIFDLSLFGTKSPSDFQLYTPHAPSCSEPLEAQEVSFTLVSQLSNDRLWMIPYHCERWGDNPMSIVVFTDRTSADVKSELISNGCSEESLTLRTVKRTKFDPSGTEYPVNLLRNLAMSAVKTSHILYADVDFWPSSDLFTIISNATIKERLASDSKLAAVIPVFQMERMCREYRDCRETNIPKMPRHKKGLMWLLDRRGAHSFDPTNKGGHGSTKYKTWEKQTTSTFVDLTCIKSNRYEPYLALRYCSELPPFQEGFTGYGKNKMTVSSM